MSDTHCPDDGLTCIHCHAARAARAAQWEAVRDAKDRRRVSYWRLTTDPSSRTAALGAVSTNHAGTYADEDGCIEGRFRARTYTWERGERQGSPGGEVLGWFPTKHTAMRAVEEAVR